METAEHFLNLYRAVNNLDGIIERTAPQGSTSSARVHEEVMDMQATALNDWRQVLPQLHAAYHTQTPAERKEFLSRMKRAMRWQHMKPASSTDPKLDYRAMMRPLRDVKAGECTAETFTPYDINVSCIAAYLLMKLLFLAFQLRYLRLIRHDR